MGYDTETPPDFSHGPEPGSHGPRPYIGVHFECCGAYSRIYRSPEQREYRGRCPRCLRIVVVKVGPGGTSSRMFRAT